MSTLREFLTTMMLGSRLRAAGLCAALLSAFPLDAIDAQETADPASPIEGEGEEEPASTEGRDTDEEKARRPADRFLFPETSLARERLGDLPALRSSTVTPPNVLRNVSRPDSLLRVGSFAIQPSAAITASYDDNADASNSERDDEFGGNISGSLRAQSLFERHSVGVQANVVSSPFNRDGEELFDWSLGADGRLDLTSRSFLSAAIAGTYGTEDVESAEASEGVDADGDGLAIVDVAGTVVYAQQFNRTRLALSGGVARIDAQADDSGLDDEADQRDSTTYTTGLGVNYALTRRLGLFGDLEYELAEFDSDSDSAGGSRDSQSIEGLAGIDMRLGRALSIRLGGGYSSVFFDDPERDTSQNFTAQLALNGAISLDRVTVVGLSLQHETEQTTVEDAALANTTTFGGTISRAISRRSAVQATVEGARRDFQDLDRTDYDVVAQLAYSLGLTRHLSLDASYRFSQRFSDDDEDEFYRNIVAVGLRVSF